MIYKVLYIPRWWSPDFWTINSITSQASRKNTVGYHLMLEILLGVVSPLSAWDLNLVQEPGQPTLAASMMPKKTKLHANQHISIDA